MDAVRQTGSDGSVRFAEHKWQYLRELPHDQTSPIQGPDNQTKVKGSDRTVVKY